MSNEEEDDGAPEAPGPNPDIEYTQKRSPWGGVREEGAGFLRAEARAHMAYVVDAVNRIEKAIAEVRKKVDALEARLAAPTPAPPPAETAEAVSASDLLGAFVSLGHVAASDADAASLRRAHAIALERSGGTPEAAAELFARWCERLPRGSDARALELLAERYG